jgi:ketosteroid isomerase-like protein
MVMKAVGFLFIITTAIGAAPADDSEKVRSALRDFSDALQTERAESLSTFFTRNADYRDSVQTLNGADALTSLLANFFANRQVWSERTPPMLIAESIKFVSPSVAFVDAKVVQYGSTITRSSVPVVLLLEKEADVWKISSWRTTACLIPLA